MATFNYNPANDQTYQQILAGYKQQQQAFANQQNTINQGYQGMIDANQGYGQSQQIALNQQFDRNSATAQQSMVSRGMGNTTNLDSANRGIEYDRANAQIGLNDSMLNRQTGLQQAYLGQQSQAAMQGAQLQGQALDYQGQALGQRYGAEAQYVSQHDLAQQGLVNQNTLQTNQQNYALQSQQNQFAHDNYVRSQYGYY